MKMIERLSLVEKHFSEQFNLPLETFYNISCTGSTVHLQGGYNSNLTKYLSTQINLTVEKLNGFVTGVYVIASNIEGDEAVTVEITLT